MSRHYDYGEGHVETVAEYLHRGGRITRPTVCGFSRHRTEEQTLLSVLCGGTEEDADRGFAWADLTPEVRELVRERAQGLFAFDDVIAEEQ